MADPENKTQIPAGQFQPLPGIEVERDEPIHDPVSQPIPKAELPAAEPEKIVDIPAEPTPPAYISDPYRQIRHKRLGGSTPNPEGQATAERKPVREDTPKDRVVGAEQARAMFERLGGDPLRPDPSESIDQGDNLGPTE